LLILIGSSFFNLVGNQVLPTPNFNNYHNKSFFFVKSQGDPTTPMRERDGIRWS
jgi:hypothetical protein